MKETNHPHMSEGNRPPEKISRRDFNKLAAAVLGGIGLGGATYSGLKVLEGLGLRFGPQEPVSNNFFYEESRRLGRSTQAAATPTPFEPQATQEPTPEPSPTPERESLWSLSGIDFSDSTKTVDMGFFIGSDTVLVPAFIPFAYYEGALDDGAFAPDSNTGLTYLDSNNRKILNLHSGRRGSLDTQGYTMWGMQSYLEDKPNGNRRIPREVNELISSSLVGSKPVIRQGETSSMLRVVAAIRIPPNGVSASQDHVADIADWLGATYPESDFGNLGKDRDTLIIKFCGRILTGETADDTRPSYQQSRFFIALKKA